MLQVIHRDGYVCKVCGVSGTKVKLTLDHVRPLSEGGVHKPINLQLLCPECHRHKDHLSEQAKKKPFEMERRMDYLFMSEEEKEIRFKQKRAEGQVRMANRMLRKLPKLSPRRVKYEAILKANLF